MPAAWLALEKALQWGQKRHNNKLTLTSMITGGPDVVCVYYIHMMDKMG